MESTIDLILKGHFHELKDSVNEKSGHTTNLKALCTAVEEAIHHLENNRSKENEALIEKLKIALQQANPAYGTAFVMKKKPMKKAGKKKDTQSQKKAM